MGIAEAFATAKAQGRAALIGYLPAGYPTVPQSHDLIRAMVAGGVDAVEVGMPYSDPVMDGPAIQATAEVSLAGGTTMADAIDLVRTVAASGAAACLMSYWNPIERYGLTRFAEEFAAAGGSAVITPDLSPEESEPWRAATDRHGVGRVYLVAPSSRDARVASVAALCTGFVYAASTMGVTGNDIEVGQTARTLVQRVRAVTSLPVAVGLGIRTREQARAVAAYADGVIVGSAFVRAAAGQDSPSARCDAVRELAAELAAGCRDL